VLSSIDLERRQQLGFAYKNLGQAYLVVEQHESAGEVPHACKGYYMLNSDSD
jgi:hypothetical protein